MTPGTSSCEVGVTLDCGPERPGAVSGKVVTLDSGCVTQGAGSVRAHHGYCGCVMSVSVPGEAGITEYLDV